MAVAVPLEEGVLSPPYLACMAAIAFLRPVRPNFHRDPSIDELGALGKHLAFLQGLVSAGHVVLAGPSEDGALGVVVFPHDSATQAEERMREDPAVAAGVFTCEVQAWRVSLFGTGSTRDWFGFTQVIHIRTDAVNAWRMLATCDGLERWFLGKADAWTHDGRQWPREVSLEHGAKLRMTWMCVGACDERGTFSTEEQSEDNDVLRTEAPQRIRLGWYSGKGWVEFRVSPHLADGRVTIELEQRMHPSSDFRQLEQAYIGCREGWAFYLTNLKSVLEYGTDLRERTPDRKGIINL